jgi:hypothetical protein
MKLRLTMVAGFLCGGLAGCGILPGLENQEPAPEQPAAEQGAAPEQAGQAPAPKTRPEARRQHSEVDDLLAYFQYIRKLSATELGREHDTVRQAFLYSRSDFDRMRLAVLLSLPGAAVTDEQRALELLDPVAKNPVSKLGPLAMLLASNLHERKRLDASAQGLQQKLDALMLLERNMIERKR